MSKLKFLGSEYLNFVPNFYSYWVVCSFCPPWVQILKCQSAITLFFESRYLKFVANLDYFFRILEFSNTLTFRNLNSRWDKNWKQYKKNQNLLLNLYSQVPIIQFLTVLHFEIRAQGGTKTENNSKIIRICY